MSRSPDSKVVLRVDYLWGEDPHPADSHAAVFAMAANTLGNFPEPYTSRTLKTFIDWDDKDTRRPDYGQVYREFSGKVGRDDLGTFSCEEIKLEKGKRGERQTFADAIVEWVGEGRLVEVGVDQGKWSSVSGVRRSNSGQREQSVLVNGFDRQGKDLKVHVIDPFAGDSDIVVGYDGLFNSAGKYFCVFSGKAPERQVIRAIEVVNHPEAEILPAEPEQGPIWFDKKRMEQSIRDFLDGEGTSQERLMRDPDILAGMRAAREYRGNLTHVLEAIMRLGIIPGSDKILDFFRQNPEFSKKLGIDPKHPEKILNGEKGEAEKIYDELTRGTRLGKLGPVSLIIDIARKGANMPIQALLAYRALVKLTALLALEEKQKRLGRKGSEGL